MFSTISKLEYLNQTFDYINIFVIGLVIVRIVNLTLKYHQQAHYSLKSFLDFMKYFYISLNGLALLGLIPMIFFLDSYIVMIINSIYLLLLDISYHRIKKILPLNHTFRVLRIILVNVILNIVFATLFMYYINLVELMSMLNILIIIQPILLFASTLILYPLDILIKLYYKNKAKKKTPLNVVGVTGSNGKSSTKDYIYEILHQFMVVSKNPYNYNNEYGIIKTLNDYYFGEDSLILEYAVSNKGDMDKNLSVISPNYCVITNISKTHLDNFNSINEILDEKAKITKDAKKIIINGDDNLLIDYFKNIDVIKVGFNSNCDFIISDLKSDINLLEFKLEVENKKYEVKTKLNGWFNAYNLSYAICVCNKCFNIDISKIINATSNITNTYNRLNIEKRKNYTLLNDSYNSNLEGFKGAIEILLKFENKVLITPGICESTNLVNEEIADFICKYDDIKVILIKNENSNIIYRRLQKNKYQNVEMVCSLNEALKHINDNDTVLIENDIPDLYNYKRLFWSVVK